MKKFFDWLRFHEKYCKKIALFFAGWFTIPSLTGGWLYDLFGTGDWAEIWDKMTHPSIWLDGFTVYTIAFLTFDFLPERINKRNWFVKLFYFICYYLVLLKIVRILFS